MKHVLDKLAILHHIMIFTVTVPEEITEEALQKLNQQSSLEETDQPKQGHVDCTIELQFWDFAGQQLYYTTHQACACII